MSIPSQAEANWTRDGIATFVADNWPDRKHTLAEIEAGIRAIEIRPPDAAAQPPSQELSQPTADEIAEAMECEFSARADGSWPDDDISVVLAWLKHGPAILAARGSKP